MARPVTDAELAASSRALFLARRYAESAAVVGELKDRRGDDPRVSLPATRVAAHDARGSGLSHCLPPGQDGASPLAWTYELELTSPQHSPLPCPRFPIVTSFLPPQVLHNLAVAEYYAGGCTDPGTLLERLAAVKVTGVMVEVGKGSGRARGVPPPLHFPISNSPCPALPIPDTAALRALGACF